MTSTRPSDLQVEPSPVTVHAGRFFLRDLKRRKPSSCHFTRPPTHTVGADLRELFRMRKNDRIRKTCYSQVLFER